MCIHTFIRVFIYVYIYTSDNKSVYIQLFEYLYLCIPTFIQVFILICVKKSFQKFKTNSYCVGGRHRSATTKIYGDITSKGSKVLIGYCSICSRKKSMTVNDTTIQRERSGNFFKNLGKKGLNVSKKMAKNVLSNPGRALDLAAILATAAVS